MMIFSDFMMVCMKIFLLESTTRSIVKQDIAADTLFSRLGDFAVSRILIFADAGMEHSTSTLLFYCRNEKTAVSISLVNSCIPFRNTGEVLKSLLCVVCVLKVHATSSSDTARHTVLVERWINSSSSDRCLILKMNSLFFDFSDFFIAVIYFR